MIIGIIREGKVPPDSRVALTPQQCKRIQEQYGIKMIVEPSEGRCFKDEEYQEMGIPLSTDLSRCDLLLGVKEVPKDQLIPGKTYCFFSHTIKEQPYNRDLLQSILKKNIRLIDYEVLTDEEGKRLIAFGRFAGMVGAHNALYTYGERTGRFALKRMHQMKDYAEAKALYQTMSWPPVKIVLTGTGRVGAGAAEVLLDMGIKQVSPKDYLEKDFDQIVFTQLRVPYYFKHKAGLPFSYERFFKEPEQFESHFSSFAAVSDIMINGIFWDNKAPAFFTPEEMTQPSFRIKTIADVTCDIAPVSSIPATLRASTINDPVFGYDPKKNEETAPYQDHVIDMMTIDNLPNELPRDASQAFGHQFLTYILPEFLEKESELLLRATVTVDGQLGPHFEYLQHYAYGIDEASNSL